MRLNTWIVSGNLCRDPEQRYVKGGELCMTTGALAIDGGFGDRKKTGFMKFTAFGKVAERIADNCRKGQEVVFTGACEPDEYENRDGDTVKTWKMTVREAEWDKPRNRDEHQHHDSDPEEEGPPPGQGYRATGTEQPRHSDPTAPPRHPKQEEVQDDLPF